MNLKEFMQKALQKEDYSVLSDSVCCDYIDGFVCWRNSSLWAG